MRLKRFTPLVSAFGLASAAAISFTSSVSKESLLSATDSASVSNVSTTELSSTSSLVAGSPKATVPGQIFPFSRTRPIIGTIYLKPYDSRPSVAWSSSSPSTTTSEDDAPASATPSWTVADVVVNVLDEGVQDLKLKGPIDDFNTKDWDWVTLNSQTHDNLESATPSTTTSTTPATSSTITTSKQSETHIFIHMGQDGKLTEVTNTKDFPLTFPSTVRDTTATTTREPSTTVTGQFSIRAVPTTNTSVVSTSISKSIKTTLSTTTTKLSPQQIADEIAKTEHRNFHDFEEWSSTKYQTLTVRPHTSYYHTLRTRTINASWSYENHGTNSTTSEWIPCSTSTFTQPINTSDARLKMIMTREDEAMRSLMTIEFWRERMTACGFKKREVEATGVVETADPAWTEAAVSKKGVVRRRAELDERAVDPACYDPNASKKGVICPRPELNERAIDPACYDPNASKKGVICPRPEVEERAVDPACYDPNASKKGVICPRPELDERVDPACFDPNADKKGVICPRPAME